MEITFAKGECKVFEPAGLATVHTAFPDPSDGTPERHSAESHTPPNTPLRETSEYIGPTFNKSTGISHDPCSTLLFALHPTGQALESWMPLFAVTTANLSRELGVSGYLEMPRPMRISPVHILRW